MARRQWTAEQKTQIVLESLASGANLTELCRSHQVCVSQVYTWREKFLESGTAALTNGQPSDRQRGLEAECQRLHELIGKLTVENEALKRGRPWVKR